MSEFVFLYRECEAARSPEGRQQRIRKWTAWFQDLSEKGHIKDPGHPLEHSGRLVKGREKMGIDGPFAEAKEVIGGYTLIEARDLEQTVELSKGCPVLEVDGTVEVRPVLKLNM